MKYDDVTQNSKFKLEYGRINWPVGNEGDWLSPSLLAN